MTNSLIAIKQTNDISNKIFTKILLKSIYQTADGKLPMLSMVPQIPSPSHAIPTNPTTAQTPSTKLTQSLSHSLTTIVTSHLTSSHPTQNQPSKWRPPQQTTSAPSKTKPPSTKPSTHTPGKKTQPSSYATPLPPQTQTNPSSPASPPSSALPPAHLDPHQTWPSTPAYSTTPNA